MTVARIAFAVALFFGSAAWAQVPLDAATFKQFSPRARDDVIAVIIERWHVAKAAGLDEPRRFHHFLAQIATETGGLRMLDEDLHYSAPGLLKTFPSYFKTMEEAQALAKKPEQIANRVYGNRLGNKLPGDGWAYRGSGLIQLTGRYNFHHRGIQLGMDLENKPELARTLPTAFDAAVAYWKARNINAAADANNAVQVRALVNGGDHGLQQAWTWLALARQYFGVGGAESGGTEEVADAVRAQLSTLGFLAPTPTESIGDATVEAMRRFQQSRGIPVTGMFDQATLYELTDPKQFKAE